MQFWNLKADVAGKKARACEESTKTTAREKTPKMLNMRKRNAWVILGSGLSPDCNMYARSKPSKESAHAFTTMSKPLCTIETAQAFTMKLKPPCLLETAQN